MMLLPTSPLRLPEDVRGSVNLFLSRQAKAVISVVDLGKYMTNLRYLRGVRLQMVSPDENKNAQRQGLEKLYSVNGSIFVARPVSLRAAVLLVACRADERAPRQARRRVEGHSQRFAF